MNEVSGRGTDANRDPITKTPGAHPVGTGVGAAGGAAAGAAIGAVGGPVGAAVGLVAGAVVGGLAGKGIAEKIDPTVEDGYWKDNYSKRSYAESNVSYDTYRPAYRTGYDGYARYPGKKYEEVKSDLQRDYEKSRGNSNLTWEKPSTPRVMPGTGWRKPFPAMRMVTAVNGIWDKTGRAVTSCPFLGANQRLDQPHSEVKTLEPNGPHF